MHAYGPRLEVLEVPLCACTGDVATLGDEAILHMADRVVSGDGKHSARAEPVGS